MNVSPVPLSTLMIRCKNDQSWSHCIHPVKVIWRELRIPWQSLFSKIIPCWGQRELHEKSILFGMTPAAIIVRGQKGKKRKKRREGENWIVKQANRRRWMSMFWLMILALSRHLGVKWAACLILINGPSKHSPVSQLALLPSQMPTRPIDRHRALSSQPAGPQIAGRPFAQELWWATSAACW